MTPKSRTIGPLSRATNVKVTTIRYYESIGLLPEPDRSASGQRLYDDAAFDRLRFIRHARDLGFSVDAIRELIELQTDASEDCSHVDEIARRHLSEVRRRLGQLEALEGELERMLNMCEGGNVGECAILECLADHENCLADEHEKPEIALGAER